MEVFRFTTDSRHCSAQPPIPARRGRTRLEGYAEGTQPGFGARPSAQGLVPIVTAGCLDSLIHANLNELLETLSWRIAATRSSSFVKNFGWPFCMNEAASRGIAAVLLRLSPRVSGFRLFVIEQANRKLGRIIQMGDSENRAQ
jgi:hypothetical protein